MTTLDLNQTYKTLTDQFYAWLQSNCHNIDQYSSSVSAGVKAGYHTRIAVAAPNSGGIDVSIAANTVLPVVPMSTVTSQFTEFLFARGISQKSTQKLTTRGLLNFWNNVAAFCAAKLVIAAGQWSPTPIRMYKSAGSVYPSVANVDNEHDAVPAKDTTALLDALTGTINNATKLWRISYSLVPFCSCSSSSSSSSSCSSSSSSSIFIAYMRLPS